MVIQYLNVQCYWNRMFRVVRLLHTLPAGQGSDSRDKRHQRAICHESKLEAERTGVALELPKARIAFRS
jgi:hypothetical protein